MKYLVLVPDGAADYGLPELDGRTPMQVARTPHMDRLAIEGCGGLVQMIPESRHPGSDVGNLEIFGYDSTVHYTGRAPLEAASMAIPMGPDDVAWRCNTISRDGDTLVDYSAGHISTEEGRALIEAIAEHLQTADIRFYPGVGYRHIVVYTGGPEQLTSHAPHDIMGQSIQSHLPEGAGQEQIRGLMDQAEPILVAHPVNENRIAQGQASANAIWLWGSGRPLVLPTVAERYGLQAGVISAVDLVRGIGRCAGYDVIDVPGITGYLDTNYEGKADHALAALAAGTDLVYVHVESPDECGHNGDWQAKVTALEDFDDRVVGRILQDLKSLGEPCRLLMTPDHRTPIPLRTHSREPVPFVLWGEGFDADNMNAYDEVAAEAGSLQLTCGHELMTRLIPS
jgi:2,3-bisphosphoglycerate-independent phosphoglycerate mutase